MAVLLWRCLNPSCATNPAGMPGFDFQAPAPVCPKCKRDGRQRQFANFVHKIEVVHLHVADAAGPDIGEGSMYRVVCGGSLFGKRGTGVPAAVTCPACKASNEYEALLPDEEKIARDYEIELNMAKQQVVALDDERLNQADGGAGGEAATKATVKATPPRMPEAGK